MVFNWIKARKDAKTKAKALYYAAATQARGPVFYESMGVPDSIDGRFEMTSLHVFLLVNALKDRGDKPARRLSQALFDQMFRVTDQAIREMGIGDLSVPRHMKRMMKAFNGRAHVYGEALSGGDDEALRAGLRRNVYGTIPAPDEGHIQRLAAYVRQAQAGLRAEDVLAGTAIYPVMDTRQTEEERRYG